MNARIAFRAYLTQQIDQATIGEHVARATGFPIQADHCRAQAHVLHAARLAFDRVCADFAFDLRQCTPPKAG